MTKLMFRTLASDLLIAVVLSGCAAHSTDEQAKRPQDEQAKIVVEVEKLGGKVQFELQVP